MKEVTSREKVLKNIREALTTSVEPPFSDISRDADIYRKESEELPEIRFAEAFKDIGGKFVYCSNEKEFRQQVSTVMKTFGVDELFCNDNNITSILESQNIPFVSDVKCLEAYDCTLTGCEYLIARTGSVVVCAEDSQSRSVYFTSPIHFVLAYTSQIVEDVSDALKEIKARFENMPRFISFVSGPSRTADIEKTLVMGAHGPKELVLFLIDDLA